ncbi:hypothetical protein N6B72_10465 [Chryseobacterium soli]|uniref:hypothetical protein n=1 Tax=Chryseobacterium soli TaxID=445961 RepID=UPI00295473EA|nr:hypothetical protein [Chryseobacterium soli]MDV7697343.1 hypothetical protein [Chryseobacterium soli]
MLDFYFLQDNESQPSYPEQAHLSYAGELDDHTFKNLQDKKVIGKQFEYYSDFRWPTEVISQMERIISENKLQDDTDVQQLMSIFKAAAMKKSGLIAYGD